MLRLAIPKLGDLEAGQILHKSHVRPIKSMETGHLLYKRPAKQSLHPSGPNWGMCTLKPFESGEGRSEDLQWAQNAEDSLWGREEQHRSSCQSMLGDLCTMWDPAITQMDGFRDTSSNRTLARVLGR